MAQETRDGKKMSATFVILKKFGLVCITSSVVLFYNDFRLQFRKKGNALKVMP